ncbi:ATP-binding cassette domain-containing protein [Mucilaginibacter sp. RS28]|uniref:ATP-binding cassette domain-containing protein n=2 Tax=Mucilaginibacter straminoryzae TaxID=2932774 RepID=A0A9X2BAU9_9SPHI|nr:ATP-binding cassette domain-containing protein [Mucilaginibacter straminoryzae]
MDHGLFTISLDNIGRRFNRDWIFRRVNFTFTSGESYAILGPNGSGKSTLLQVLNASMGPSEGKISYTLNNAPLSHEHVYQHLALAAPYLELIEDFSMEEMIDFHFKFKSYLPGTDKQQVISLLNLKGGAGKQIRYFSSGMKQRLKLALAFCSDTPILMLDEPTSNLDQQGVDWYLQLVGQFTRERLTIVCSNQPHEYAFCKHQLNISDYKN